MRPGPTTCGWRARLRSGQVMNAGATTIDLWAALEQRVDPNELRPEVGDWVETQTLGARGGHDSVMVANTRQLVYYRLAPAEAAVLPLMDGTRTTSEILVARLNDSGELDVRGLVELIRSLQAGGFLTERYVDVHAAVARALAPTGLRSRIGKAASTLTVEWSGAEKMTIWLHDHGLRLLFNRVGAVVASLVALVGLVAFGAIESGGHFEFTAQSIGLGFVVLFVLNLVLVFIHELGHASYLVHYGRRVRGSGFRLYFGSPAFFIDSSDVLMLDRRKRMAQSFAGPYFELVATGVAAIALWLWPHGGAAQVLYRFVVLNYFVLLLNLVPMLELDGYWILSDAIRVPDLRPRSLAFMRHDLWAKLRRRERFSVSEIGIGLYGTVGVVFTIFCLLSAAFFWRRTFGGLVTNMWEAGPIGVVLLVVLGVFLAGPILRGLIELIRVLARALLARVHAIQFRLQLHWRIEAVERLDALPIFEDLSVDVLNDIAGRVTLCTVSAQTTVIRQGERADAFFVVRSGRLDVIETDPDTLVERVLQSLGPGDTFGEIGLATGAVRNATVRAASRSVLFAVDKPTFDRLLADHIHLPDVAPTIQALTELRALPVFAALGAERLDDLRAQGEWIAVVSGETLITQGDPGDAFYAVGTGRFDVLVDAERVDQLGPGEHFGEIALLASVPRTATVRAATPGRVFRLGRAGFERLVADGFQDQGRRSEGAIEFIRE